MNLIYSTHSTYFVRKRLIRSPTMSYTRISHNRLQKWYNHILVCPFKVSWYVLYNRCQASYADCILWSRVSYVLTPASSWTGAQIANACFRSRVMCHLWVACGLTQALAMMMKRDSGSLDTSSVFPADIDGQQYFLALDFCRSLRRATKTML
jgi:hypothetical protein